MAWSDPEHTYFKAFDHEGNEKWSLDLGAWVSQHGFGQSPMIYNDLVIITCSQEPSKQAGVPEPRESFIVAVEKATGKTSLAERLQDRHGVVLGSDRSQERKRRR